MILFVQRRRGYGLSSYVDCRDVILDMNIKRPENFRTCVLASGASEVREITAGVGVGGGWVENYP